MRCPKCGTENPDESQICKNCSYVLISSTAEEPKLKAGKSKLAIGSGLLSGLAVALTIFLKPALAFSLALIGIAAAIGSIIEIKKSEKKLLGKSFAIAVIIFSTLHIVILSYLRVDAPPIPNDYTVADLRLPPKECLKSYEILQCLADINDNLPNALAIGLSEQDVNDLYEINEIFKEDDYGKMCTELKANEETILQIWQNAKKGRDIIDGLDAFPEIADLAEPDLKYEIHFMKNLRRLVYLHRAYICLQSYEGNEETALKELFKLDDIIRKLNINARSLVMKLVCMACFTMDVKTANFMANNPMASKESLSLLSDRFKSTTKEQVPLRNSIIFEYLMFKNELTKMSEIKGLRYSSFSLLKLNSTLRVYRNFCDDWIAISEGKQGIPEDNRLTIWPSMYPELPVYVDPNGNTQWYYKVYNPMGAMFVVILMPAYERIVQINTKVLIHYDLLQIVLNKRLGKEFSLKARAYGDEYVVDLENKKIFGSGPDGEPHTKDDIKLLINPEVLNFTN